MKQYDTAVVIGRFQGGPHNAHVALLQKAAELAEHVLVIVGSANQPRTFKNPFTDQERKDLIRDVVIGNKELFPKHTKFSLMSNTDTIYNDNAWVQRVQAIISNNTETNEKVVTLNSTKQGDYDYGVWFPQWSNVKVEIQDNLDATKVRELYFSRKCNMDFIKGVVPKQTLEFLEDFRATEEYQQIIREVEHIADYKKQFASLPYPPIFLTADAVVVQSGHILMIKRKAEPGKGLWALPGGFMNAATDASSQDAAIRELREETGLKVPEKVLVGSIKGSREFAAINRSARGRTITNAFHIVLPNGELPPVRGQDDAEKAKWIPLNEVNSSKCFEDHYEIIQYFTGVN